MGKIDDILETDDFDSALEMLTEKQREFVLSFDGSICDTAYALMKSETACLAMYRKPHIRHAIFLRNKEEVYPDLVAGCEERKAWWTHIMREERYDISDRLKASTYLAKADGDFVDRHVVEGGEPIRVIHTAELEDRVKSLSEDTEEDDVFN